MQTTSEVVYGTPAKVGAIHRRIRELAGQVGPEATRWAREQVGAPTVVEAVFGTEPYGQRCREQAMAADSAVEREAWICLAAATPKAVRRELVAAMDLERCVSYLGAEAVARALESALAFPRACDAERRQAADARARLAWAVLERSRPRTVRQLCEAAGQSVGARQEGFALAPEERVKLEQLGELLRAGERS